MDIRFGDHPSFHRAAAGMVAGSALVGLALHPFTPFAPVVGGVAGIAIGSALGYGKPIWRLAAGALASIPLILFAPTGVVTAASAALLALGLTAGLRGVRGLVTVGLGMATALVAMWVAVRFGHAQKLQSLAGWQTDALAATAMGIVGVLATLPRHLSASTDPVRAAMRKLPKLDSEVQGLCDRSVAIWTAAKDKLADGDSHKTLLRDGVVKTLEVAVKSADVQVTGSAEELANRMTELDKRIEAATDAEVKTQYQAARAGLADQKRYRDSIANNRERLVARMHNHVVALEKFQLAATGLEAARVTAPTKALEELSHDVAVSGEALADVEMAS